MDIAYVENLPIAQPTTDTVRQKVELAVEALIQRTTDRRHNIGELTDWLRTEFGVLNVGQKLEDFVVLDETAFIDQVRKRRETFDHFSPASLRALRESFSLYSEKVRGIEREIFELEKQISNSVNQAYGLTTEDIDLMWRTAPPRMPIQP